MTNEMVGEVWNGQRNSVMPFGETVADAYSLVFYLKSDGKLYRARADAAETARGPLFLCRAASVTANGYGDVLAMGLASKSTWNWTVGGELYLSPTTLGAMTQTKPDPATQIVRALGHAVSATTISFRPFTAAQENAFAPLPAGTFGDTLFHDGTGWGVENTGPLTTPKRTLILQGASLIVPDTNGAKIVTETLAGGRLIRGASFGASASDITAQIGHPMPANWDGGTVTAQFLFATAATAGTVTFSLAGRASVSDDGLDQAFGTPQSATLDIAAQPGKAAWDLWTTDPTNPITLAGSPQGAGRRWVQWRITRDAVDTCAEDVLLLAVVIEYGTDGYSDA